MLFPENLSFVQALTNSLKFLRFFRGSKYSGGFSAAKLMLALSYIALEVIKLTKSARDPAEEDDKD